MTDLPIRLPDAVRKKVESLGPPGVAWLAGLPQVLAELARRWSLRLGAPTGGGTSSYVVRATTAEGVDVVVKVSVPDPTFDRQARTLRAAGGDGYVQLLEYDARRSAVLLEALGPTLADSDRPPEQQIEVMCDLLPTAWRAPTPQDGPPYDKAESLHRLVSSLGARTGAPMPAHVVDRALDYAERRSAAFGLHGCVIVHGDPAPQNTLRTRAPRAGATGGYVFVDPDGFVGDPAYDLGVVLRGWGEHVLAADAGRARATAGRLCRLIAERTQADEQAIWEWGFLERVSTGLYAWSFGAHELARPFIDSACALA